MQAYLKLGGFKKMLVVQYNSIGKSRVTKGRYNPILSSSLRVVERAKVLPEFLETWGDLTVSAITRQPMVDHVILSF